MARFLSLLLLSATLLAASAPAAAAADAFAGPTRSLFLSERFTPTGVRPPLTRGPQPHQLVALRGEREGFQLALRNDTGGSLALRARILPDAALAREQASGRIDAELLRVLTVHVPRGSTGMGTSGGAYADPMPPFGTGTAGSLQVPAGQWGAVSVLLAVRTDATAARYAGTLELYTGTGAGERVRARQPFTLTVRPRTLLRPGARHAFNMVLGVEGETYWLQHSAMRNGRSAGYPSSGDRMLQLDGLLSFFDSRGATPIQFPFATPDGSGRYGCVYDAPGDAPARSFREHLSRYFARLRELDRETRQFRARVIPTRSSNCNQDDTRDDFHGTVDHLRTPSVKQDDSLDPGFTGFVDRVDEAWRAAGWYGPRTYAFNPFDEPGDATAAQRRTMNTQVPAANVAIRRAVQGRARIALTSWPRQAGLRRVCRTVSGTRRCTRFDGEQYGNRRLWDGRGADDVDVWVAPLSRMHGRVPTAAIPSWARQLRTREYADRLAAVRRQGPTKETWGYNFFTATRTMPQLSIDAPGTDARLHGWLLARDGHTGLFVSNSMMGWGTEVRRLDNGLRRKGNPWDEATYFQHRNFGYAAGWGTFVYPGYRPELGLASEEQRNTAGARPVTSLRMEGLRDAQEDANLVAMYRARFGAAATNAQLRRIFPGGSRRVHRKLGNVVLPTWSNANLAQRLEARRRAMIMRLSR